MINITMVNAPMNLLRRQAATLTTLAALWLLASSVSAHAASAVPASFADMVDKLVPAVVNISSTQKVSENQGMGQMFQLPPGPEYDPFREFFDRFGQQQDEGGEPREVFSLGSGFIIDPQGFVVTNNHVIEGAEEIEVILHDDRKLKAKIIGRDTKTDLALLKLASQTPPPYVPFGNSDNVRVGDWVIAIGNPFGLGGTVTAGIISARSRSINAGPFDDFLQTDAAINRGNSGGPMFNMNGEVIGINSAIFSPSGGNIGIGFAVPSALAEPVLKQLKEFGRTHRGWLGIKIQQMTDEIAESLGLKETHGALVLEATDNAPAKKAGIEVGDVIIKFDGHEVTQMRHLPRIVAETAIGKHVQVEIWRNGVTKTVEVVLGELDESEDQADAEDSSESKQKEPSLTSKTVLGLGLATLDNTLRQRLGVDKSVIGLVITEVKSGSEAAKRGLQFGDIVVQVGNMQVVTIANFEAAIQATRKSGRKYALIRILRAGEILFVTLPVTEKK